MSMRRIAVENLVTGLYVGELDRPWTETPFLFQGFLIETEADIRALREHCDYVWVDRDRSREPASRTPPMPEPGYINGSAVNGARRGVGNVAELQSRFSTGLTEGLAARRYARECLARVLGELSRSNTGPMPRDLVQSASRLAGFAAEYPEVAHWLANLEAHHERLISHSVNVTVRSLLFARHLGLAPAEVAVVGLGALLHDIGKVTLPRELLDKPGPLSREEWGMIRRHPAAGTRLLADSRLPETVGRIVRYHHERIDGRGFPEGLRGDELDLPVRLVGLVNAFDGMTSERPDRERLSGYQAVTRLMRDADRTWGRALVEAFVRCVGIYPAGTRVRLSSGAEAVVVNTPPERRLQPMVCVYRRPDGASETRLPLMDLAIAGASGNRSHIEQVIEPDGGEGELLEVITRQAFAA